MNIEFWTSVEPEDLFRAIADKENREKTLNVIRKLTPDPVWTKPLVDMIEAGQVEIRSALHWLAMKFHPKTYLEVGVRRGFSLAMVASQCPEAEIYGFDLWIPQYAGVDNLGPKFVQSEIRNIGYNKTVHFFNGDSHKTLPVFFQNGVGGLWNRLRSGRSGKPRPKTFDLIAIDGDHSLLGSYQDLIDNMPYCSVGGVVVFDDLVTAISPENEDAIKKEWGEDPYGWKDPLGVWHAIQERFPNFRYFEYTDYPPGVGLAVRLE
jgi:predicted O-methyltransferase YrrM